MIEIMDLYVKRVRVRFSSFSIVAFPCLELEHYLVWRLLAIELLLRKHEQASGHKIASDSLTLNALLRKSICGQEASA